MKKRPLSEKEKRLVGHLARIDLAIAAMTKTVLENLYVDDLTEAYKLMDRMRGEEHVRALRDERHELEFYNKRRAELAAELEALKTSEAANG